MWIQDGEVSLHHHEDLVW